MADATADGACDAHFHVFGPAERYPVGTDLRYAPPLAPLGEFLDHAREAGIDRYVFVQPSAYGRDNSCMLDAMQMLEPSVRRGIVDIHEDAPDALLAELDAAGVRGVRINVRPIEPPTDNLAKRLIPRIDRLGARCRELGWHLDFLLPGWLTEALLPVLDGLPVPFTIAHLGMFQAAAGPNDAGFRGLLDLLRGGQGYAKLTGYYRISKQSDYGDIAPMARAAFAANPERVLFGTDFPHLSFPQPDLMLPHRLLADWFPEPTDRRRILVDNPRRLYGFTKPAGTAPGAET